MPARRFGAAPSVLPVYGLLFVNQPLEQAPNDAAFIDLLSTVVVFLTGSLGGLLASNGMKKTKQTGATDEAQR